MTYFCKQSKAFPSSKMRVPAQGRGRRGGARVVYYCGQERLIPLLIYVKSQQTDVSREDRRQIQGALRAAGLWRN